MNFDDLHDPDPPRPGMDTLAAVSGRARQIHRRRAALVTTGGVLAAAIVVVPLALAASGGDSSDRVVPATVPEATVGPPSSSSIPPATTTTTTTVPGVVPPGESTTTSILTTTTSTTSTTTLPAPAPGMVAIRADGDAVRIAADGTQTVLFDGADPRVQPGEGELTVVDSVAVAPNGRTFVSTCCEPVPGAWVELSAGSEPTFRAYGHGLDIGADGQTILSVGAQTITVSDLDGGVVTSATFDDTASPYRDPYEAAWLDDTRLVVLEYRQVDDRNELVLYVAESPSGAEAAAGVVIGTDINAPWPQLAGIGADGSLLVFQGAGDPATATSLQAYDPVTLERGEDVALPAPATYARMQDGVLTWIGVDGSLHAGETVVPGEYRWARPVS